jgi:uncharacterized protein YndB with AHSA1/START domain
MNREQRVIEREVFIAAPPEAVFKFLIDAQLMTHWLGSFQQLDPQPGGIFQVEVSPGNIARGEYTEVGRCRPLLSPHQFPGHVVYGRNVIGVHSVTEAERIGQKRGSEQDRIRTESDQRSERGAGIRRQPCARATRIKSPVAPAPWIRVTR